jgi:glycogen operon protein
MSEMGERIVGDTLLVLLNAHHEAIPFTLPLHKDGQRWERLLDTAATGAVTNSVDDDQPYQLEGRSLAVLKAPSLTEAMPASTVEANSATTVVADPPTAMLPLPEKV